MAERVSDAAVQAPERQCSRCHQAVERAAGEPNTTSVTKAIAHVRAMASAESPVSDPQLAHQLGGIAVVPLEVGLLALVAGRSHGCGAGGSQRLIARHLMLSKKKIKTVR